MKKKGSAIVIAVFLVAAIGGIAFSFGRIFLLDASSASLSENGASAYYAAESGIEEGFLRYRYNKGAEVPFNDWQIGDEKVFRANLRTNLVDTHGALFNGVPKSSTPISDNANQVYDLRMGFIGTDNLPVYGQNTVPGNSFDQNDVAHPSYGTGNYQYLKIAKDESYKIDLSNLDLTNLSANDINIFAKYSGFSDIGRAIMYAKLTIDYRGNGLDVKEYKAIISAQRVESCQMAVLGATRQACYDTIIDASPHFSPLNIVWRRSKLLSAFNEQFGAVTPLNSTKKVTLSLRPLYHDAYIGISTAKCEPSLSTCANGIKSGVVSGPFTKITSVGYYGGTSRTIQANIDRQSGTLYDLFDYVIFVKQ
jgi:hypothetical protein